MTASIPDILICYIYQALNRHPSIPCTRNCVLKKYYIVYVKKLLILQAITGQIANLQKNLAKTPVFQL